MALGESPLLDSARLLFDLQHVSQVVQAISGCLNANTIAQHVTDALVNQFDCVFARLWVVEADHSALRLVASSGLHTHVNGSFARVPMGAYKVGKIAQNRIPFLSNHLADEPWVKDREWAIANHIQGFAGYPLIARDRVIGVLAAFSNHPMPPEFLEVLQVLCMTATIALDAATQVERAHYGTHASSLEASRIPLSDQLAQILQSTRLTLMGTEQPLPVTLNHALLHAAEQLNRYQCNYCRFRYLKETVVLEALWAMTPAEPTDDGTVWLRSQFTDLRTITTWVGGTLALDWVSDRRAVRFCLELPLPDVQAAQAPQPSPPLSEREVEVMRLLTQGLRDRDIAQTLYISESTVKFHINNSLTKLNAKNRYQGVYQAAIQGCI
jgi:DNA-binding CsgD family transcriptional regulator/GAF domain-containing protein